MINDVCTSFHKAGKKVVVILNVCGVVETKTAIYLSDDWQVTNRWWLSAGVRGEYYAMGGRNAMAYLGGVDYNMNKNVGFSVNVVNILNQKGCSGSIGSADLIEDVSAYKNYVMAGSYIRPFTVEFAAHINF